MTSIHYCFISFSGSFYFFLCGAFLQVVLTNYAEVSLSPPDAGGKSAALLHLSSIEEEKLNVGIGEHVELLDRKGSVLDEPFEVIQVCCRH